jgi:hypothetical protein
MNGGTPILMLSIAVTRNFFGAEAAQGETESQLAGLVGPNGALAIQAVLAAARDTASGIRSGRDIGRGSLAAVRNHQCLCRTKG